MIPQRVPESAQFALTAVCLFFGLLWLFGGAS